jgi:type IV secretory pathway TraG/TraD family ATPase VirD4
LKALAVGAALPAVATAWVALSRLSSGVALGRPLRRRKGPGYVVVGRASGRPVGARRGEGVLVVGPTRSGKTTRLAAPVLASWEGPAVVCSVKDDILSLTQAQRARRGPIRVVGLPGVGSGWDPVRECGGFPEARRLARLMVEKAAFLSGARAGDSYFWWLAAAKPLAPLLLAAKAEGAGIEWVIEAVETFSFEEAAARLEDSGEVEAGRALASSMSKEDRQLSSLHLMLEALLEPYRDLAKAPAATAAELLAGSPTVYLCAPLHAQRRAAAPYSVLLSLLIERIYTSPRRHPVLLLLDEAAHVAPLEDLDELAATAGGLGIQLVTVFQDLSQVRARWGERAPTIWNNHPARVVLGGLAEEETLRMLSLLSGERTRRVESVTRQRGSRSTTVSRERIPVIGAAAVRTMQPGRALLVYKDEPVRVIELPPPIGSPPMQERPDRPWGFLPWRWRPTRAGQGS